MDTLTQENTSDIAAALAAVQAEMAMIRHELSTIRELLQNRPLARPQSTDNPGRFFGMWSDFDELDEAIFTEILAERSHYFSSRLVDIED
ncbi:MAG: hypothetical protein KF770_15470 [Anaerolineae bacterium]|nr:hypothetical protein [Anaerolineae bacterium]